MKSIVVYSSQTGNTQKLAKAIFKKLEGEKQIYKIEHAPDPSEFDLVCLGFWLMAGKPDSTSQEYLKKVKNQKLFLFATHGASAASQHAQSAMEFAKSLAPAANVIGTFNCPGQVSPNILEKARSKPVPPAWLADAPDAVGHPNEEDLKQLIDKLAQSLS
ncbi:MAG: flavodoxin domain-containing protein [Desulfobacterales bacterium]|nr:flavodoxin domain-containing protein [Desulfobacterales bacterium]